jgi:hypothetical protein
MRPTIVTLYKPASENEFVATFTTLVILFTYTKVGDGVINAPLAS